MADYGLLPTGFNRQRLPEIQAEILAELKTRTGLDFDADPKQLAGQFNAVFSEREAAMWEVLQAVYSAMYPPSAFGQALDDAVAFVGVRRFPASRTEVSAVLYGVSGTVVPADSVVRSTIPSGNYLLNSAVTISNLNAVDIFFSFTVANSFAYTITVNGVGYTYTSDGSATIAEILTGLGAALAATGFTVDTTALANNLRLVSPTNAAFSAVPGTNIAINTAKDIGSPGTFYAQEIGPTAPPVGTLTQIIGTVTGWNSVANLLPASVGRYEETDAELRGRYALGVFRTGAGSLPAIEANLKGEVANVSYARVYENKTNTTDADGRPAHSVEAVVVGGIDADILQMLFEQVAGGIETYGTTSGSVVDSEGVTHTIKFTRPTAVVAWVKVTVTKYTEEPLPDNAGALIAEAIVAEGNSFGVGKDIIPQRFQGPIYRSVSGIGNLAITVATGSTPGTYVSTNVGVGIREYSVWDASRVEVTIL